MYNGNDHETVGAPSQHVEAKPKTQPAADQKPRPANEQVAQPKKADS